jgi:hypothetical protein
MGHLLSKSLISIATERIGYKWCGGGLSAGRFYRSNLELPTREEYLFNKHESVPLNRLDASCVIHDILYSMAAKLTTKTMNQFIGLVREEALVNPKVPFLKYFVNYIDDVETPTLKDVVRSISLSADEELIFRMNYISQLPCELRETNTEKLIANTIGVVFWAKCKVGKLSVADNHGSFYTDNRGESTKLNETFSLYKECYALFSEILHSDKSIPDRTCINRDRGGKCNCQS